MSAHIKPWFFGPNAALRDFDQFFFHGAAGRVLPNRSAIPYTLFMNSTDTCGTCGGDRTIANSFGSITTCPSCRGSGRRAEDTGFRDVTKTKASHHTGSNKAAVAQKQQWPSTFEGAQLATEVKDSARLTSDAKAKLTREIIEHETSHGACTQTFLKRVRKQVRVVAH